MEESSVLDRLPFYHIHKLKWTWTRRVYVCVDVYVLAICSMSHLFPDLLPSCHFPAIRLQRYEQGPVIPLHSLAGNLVSMNYVALHLAISLQSSVSLQTSLGMDGRQQHNDLGFVFNALQRSCLISKRCNHVVFPALLKSRVMLICVTLCYSLWRRIMINFHTCCVTEKKSKWAVPLNLITSTLCHTSAHTSDFWCTALYSPAQCPKLFGKCGCRWQLYDRWSMRLLLFERERKERDATLCIPVLQGSVQSCDFPPRKTRGGKRQWNRGNDSIVMATRWHSSVFLQVLTLQFYPEGMHGDCGLSHTQDSGTNCINMHELSGPDLNTLYIKGMFSVNPFAVESQSADPLMLQRVLYGASPSAPSILVHVCAAACRRVG